MLPWIVIAIVVTFIVLPALVGFVWWNKSYMHSVDVAIQTGEDANDVVWKTDKFKVINRQGHHTIVFKFMRGGAQSPSGNLWTKYLIGKNTVINFNEALWTAKSMRNRIQRGLKLYRTLDGQFHPMTITKDGDLRVLTQDNRNFLIRSDREAQKLLLTGKQQVIAVVAVIVAIVILAICFILFLVYLGNNTDNLCGIAQASSQGILQGVQAAVGG
jgi:hypothetical protein